MSADCEAGAGAAAITAAPACRSARGPYKSRQAAWPKGTEMGRQVAGVLYGLAMAAVMVGVDFAFFRNRFLERLMVNVGIVLVFAAFYLRFFRSS